MHRGGGDLRMDRGRNISHLSEGSAVSLPILGFQEPDPLVERSG